MESITLNIDGMTCAHCVATVKRELVGLNGVTVKAVNIGNAVLEYDARDTSPERIAQAIGRAGYRVVSPTR